MNQKSENQMKMKNLLENQEFEKAYKLYKEFNVGIPIKYLYSLPEKKNYVSMSSFINNSTNKYSNDTYFIKLMDLLKKSKIIKSPEWNNMFCYVLK